jgi:hypothetical protein
VHTADPLVPELCCFEVETDVEKSKRYKSPCIDRILPELVQAGSNTLRELRKPDCKDKEKEKLPEQWKKCVGLPVLY